MNSVVPAGSSAPVTGICTVVPGSQLNQVTVNTDFARRNILHRVPVRFPVAFKVHLAELRVIPVQTLPVATVPSAIYSSE